MSLRRSVRQRSPSHGRRRPCRLAAALALGLLLAPAATAQPPAGDLETLHIPGTSLLVERPASWLPGGVRGYGILVSLIGRNEGFPSFAVMTDPEVEVEPDATEQQVEDRLEALHRALLDGKREAEVESAGWQRINGLRVHLSLTSWWSVTGRLKARRVLLVFGGRPYVLTWMERADRYDEIAEIVERCVGTLRVAQPPTVGGP